jgi:hypothetical protein
MNGLQLVEQRPPAQWPQNPLLGSKLAAHSQAPERAALREQNPFARLYGAQEDLPSARTAPIMVGELATHQAEIPLPRRGRAAQLVSSRAVRRVPYIDRSREMRWIREHQAEYADMWVALDGDRVIAADFNAKVVFAAARAASVGRPLFVHMEPRDALPFGGW